jgi:hypothetical protein
MKKIAKMFVVVCLGATTLKGCISKPVVPEFAEIVKSETFRSGEGSFELDYRFDYLSWCENEEIAAQIRTSMIADFFGAEYATVDIMESSKRFDQATADMYTAQTSGDYKWDGFIKINSHHNILNDRVLVYAIDRSEFMGGAHGMETTTYTNYDLETGDRLTLDDLFTPEGKAALTERIHAQILADHNVVDWPALSENNCYLAPEDVLPTENFELSAGHITFHYNPYDIACYAQGSTKVKLPLSGLVGFKADIIKK